MTARRDDGVIAAEYVLGILDEAAGAAAAARTAADPDFADLVEGWRLRLAPLDDTAEPQPAGDRLWQGIEAAIAAPLAASPAPASSPWMRWWTSLPALRATAAGAAAVAVVLAAGLWLALATRTETEPQLIAVLLNDGEAGAVVEAFADGRVILIPLADMQVPAGKALEVWTLPDAGTGPVSVGLMDRARTLELRLGALPHPDAEQLFEITLEPESGSPTGRPTGPVLFVGRTASTL